MHPAILLLGAPVVFGGPKKRKKKQNGSSESEGSTQKSRQRQLNVLAVQRGLHGKFKASEEEPEEQPVMRAGWATARSKQEGKPGNGFAGLNIPSMVGSDKIGVSPDGNRALLGTRWWSSKGRSLLQDIKAEHADATPEQLRDLVLATAVPEVEWDAAELPRGAQILQSRVMRFVHSSFMGHPAVDLGSQAPQAPQEAQDAAPASAEAEVQMDAETPATPEEAPNERSGRTRRGRRGRGRKRDAAPADAGAAEAEAPVEGAADQAPGEDGGDASDGSSAPEADSSPGDE